MLHQHCLVLLCFTAVAAVNTMTLHQFGYVGEFDLGTSAFDGIYCKDANSFVANNIGQCAADATATVIRASKKRQVVVMFLTIGKKTCGIFL